MRPTPTACLAAALLLAPAAAQDFSTIDLSGAWKMKGKLVFEPNEFGIKKGKLGIPLHAVHEGAVITGFALDKVPKCGTYTPPVDGTFAAGSYTLHMLAPGHDPDTCAELGHVELDVAGAPLDNLRVSVSGTGEVDIEWFVFPFTVEGSAKRVSAMQTPDDPDGPGPAVPVDQIGTGEPGSGGAHDLAIVLLKAPKAVKAKGVPASGTGVVKLRLQNRSQHAEVIDDAGVLEQLVTLELLPQGPPAFGWEAALRPPPAGKFPLLLEPRKKLVLLFDVTFTELLPGAAEGPCSLQDFEVTARVHHEALAGGLADDHPADDVAPRGVLPPYAFDIYPDGKLHDRGVGAKQPDGTLGAAVVVQAGYCSGGT